MGAGEAAGHTRAPAQTSGANAGGHGHGGHGEEFEFGEVMVHQVRLFQRFKCDGCVWAHQAMVHAQLAVQAVKC